MTARTFSRPAPVTHLPGDGLRLQILGPIRAWDGASELQTGPPLQSLLLAILAARVGQPVGAHELVDLIWGPEPPPSALNSVHKYVGALRRLLEPQVGSRQEGSYLHRRGAGYLCLAGPDVLDLAAFRGLVGEARIALARFEHQRAMDCYDAALALWSGPAGGGDHRTGADAVFSALDAEFLDACGAAAALAAQLGQHHRVIAPLALGASIDPLHEPVLAGLVTALGAVGRQAEALSVFEDARLRLADELGVDPGAALAAAHVRVLRPPPAQPTGANAVPDLTGHAEAVAGMVGRADEFGVLRKALATAAGGGSGLVVVEGEPGIGKTRLLEEAASHAATQGLVVVWGRCRDRDGTPSLWPWVEITQGLLDGLPPDSPDRRLTGELAQLTDPAERSLVSPVLPDTGARFRLFEQVVGLIGRVSTHRPVLVLLDDLQWADAATLELFEYLAARVPRRCVLVGALRDHAPSPGAELVHTLAGVGRQRGHRRVRLHALEPDEVAELARRIDGVSLQPDAARRIHQRTAGNPFFVRELSRLLASGAEVTDAEVERAEIPRTVLDIVRDRVSGLDDDARRLLEVAAVIGSRVEFGVLGRVLGITHAALVDRLAPVEAAGLVAVVPGAPHLLGFAHDIVRDAVVASTARTTLAAVHLAVADALERGKAGDDVAAERVAHHLWGAGALADPSRTADALICAGRVAAAKSAFDVADDRLRSAASLARDAQLPHLELAALTQLIAVDGMRSGYVGSALDALERAEALARHLGRDRDAADLLFSRWAAYSQGIQLDEAEVLARRLLRQGLASKDPLVRAYGLNAWGIHQWDVGNIGDAYDHLTRAETVMVARGQDGDEARLRRDLQLLWPVMRALMTALHGDLDAARALLDELEAEAADDPYAITVWSAFSVVIAALAGDPAAAERAAKRGIGIDPAWSFAFLGAYQRLALCWARAVSGEDARTAAAEAAKIIDTVLVNPPRSGVATWFGLLAEMWLAADRPADAVAALDRAEELLARYRQRYPEGLILILRARAMRALGTDTAAVRAVAEQAAALSVARGAGLFARRAHEFLAELATP